MAQPKDRYFISFGKCVAAYITPNEVDYHDAHGKALYDCAAAIRATVAADLTQDALSLSAKLREYQQSRWQAYEEVEVALELIQSIRFSVVWPGSSIVIVGEDVPERWDEAKKERSQATSPGETTSPV